MKGTLTYWVKDKEDVYRSVKLTVCEDSDLEVGGLGERRRRCIIRLIGEAERQGVRLSYADLGMILLSSRATLKRDLSNLRGMGYVIQLGGKGRVEVEPSAPQLSGAIEK